MLTTNHLSYGCGSEMRPTLMISTETHVSTGIIHLPAIDKLDSTMDEEYVKERFQITLDDPCKFEVSV